MRRTILAVMLWGVTAMALAGTNTWTPLGPEGGRIERIVFSPAANTVFVPTSAGIYRSTNGASSWQLVLADLLGTPTGIAVGPVDPQRVYVTVGDTPSFYRSTDGGTSFQPASPSLPYLGGKIATAYDGLTLYAATNARVFRSSDRGQSWSERTPVSNESGASVLRMVVDPGDAGTVYAVIQLVGQTVLVRTVDGGQSWLPVLSGDVWDVAVSPDAPGSLWVARNKSLSRSSDQGATWITLLTVSNFLSAVTVDPRDENVVYAGDIYGAILRTTNGGTSWAATTGTHFAGELRALAVDPANNLHVLAGGSGGLYGSSNAGASWSKQQTGIYAAWVDHLSRDSASGRIYINASTDGIYFFAPGASTAQPVDNLELRQLQGGDPRLFITSMIAQDGNLLASVSTGLARSVDGGSSWTIQPIIPGSGSQQIFSMSRSESAPPVLLTSQRSVIMRSVNGGAIWTAVGSGLPASVDIYDPLIAPSDSQKAYLVVHSIATGAPLGVYRSLDGGVTWSATGSDPATGPGRLLAIDPLTPTTLYGTAADTLLRSTDAGTTWAVVPVGAPGNGFIGAMVIDPQNTQVWNLVGGRVLRTLDGGATWDSLRGNNAKPAWLVTQALLDPARPGRLLVSTISSGVQEITTSPDLQLTGSGPSGPTDIGAPVVHKLVVTNQGPFGTTGAVVHVHWSAGASNVTVTAPGASCTTTATSANCRYAVLRNGDSASVTVTAGTVPAGTLQLDASVDSDFPDAVGANNAVTLTALVAPRAELSVTVVGATNVQESSAVNYTVTARNNGPNPATTPSLIIQLASGMTPGTVTTTAGSCMSSGPTVTCALGDLAANSTAVVTVAATANAAGAQTSSAQLTSVTWDSAGADNTATIVTTVTSPGAPTSGGSGGGGAGGGAGSGAGGGGGLAWLDLFGLLLMAASAGGVARRRSSPLRR